MSGRSERPRAAMGARLGATDVRFAEHESRAEIRLDAQAKQLGDRFDELEQRIEGRLGQQEKRTEGALGRRENGFESQPFGAAGSGSCERSGRRT